MNVIEDIVETYLTNGATVNWPYAFRADADDELVLLLVNNVLGTQTEYVVPNITVTRNANNVGGTVTYPASGPALAAGYTIYLTRRSDFTQVQEFLNQGGLWPRAVEAGLDTVTKQTQELHERLGRALLKNLHTGVYQAGGNRISGVGRAVLDTDALTLADLPALFTTLDPTSVPMFSSIAALRASSGVVSNTVYVLSWYGGEFRGGGFFRRNTLDLVTADNSGTVIVDAAGGRWYRLGERLYDVVNFGAKPNGVTDAAAAFALANTAAAAANNSKVIVSGGAFLLSSNTTMTVEVVHEGRLILGGGVRYKDANALKFSDYLRRHSTDQAAFEALIYDLMTGFTDNRVADGEGYEVLLTSPVNMSAAAGKTSYSGFHVIKNFNFTADPSFPAATSTTKTGGITINTKVLTLNNTTGLTRGMRVSGAGLGREMYITSVDSGTQVTLNTFAYATTAAQTYTFTEHKFMLDWTGFDDIARVRLFDCQFNGASVASAIRMGYDGIEWQISRCRFVNILERGIVDYNVCANGLRMQGCRMTFSGAGTTNGIGLGLTGNDAKLIDIDITTCLHHVVAHGGGLQITGGCHLWGGDNASIVLTRRNYKTQIVGNYIDNSWIELSDECGNSPTVDDAIAGVVISGNIFTGDSSTINTRWIVVKPHTALRALTDIIVAENTFKDLANGSTPTRVDSVNTALGSLDPTKFKRISFKDNAFEGITVKTSSQPQYNKVVTVASTTWVVDFVNQFPFGGYALQAHVTLREIKDGADVIQYPGWWIYDGNTLAQKERVQIRFGVAYKGTAIVTANCNALDDAP